MLPGFPVPIIGKSGPDPFTLSGTFATGLDGWVGASYTWGSGYPRTSPGAMQTSAIANSQYSIDALVAGGQSITVSIWHRTGDNMFSNSRTRSIQYSIAGGAFVTLASVNDPSLTYALLTGTFNNPGNDPVTIQVTNNGGSGVIVCYDDWSISGIPI